MKEELQDHKKPLPKRRRQTQLISPADADIIYNEAPALPSYNDPRLRPCFVLIDDCHDKDKQFLKLIEKRWRDKYKEAMELLLHKPVKKHPVVAWITGHLEQGNKIDAIFIDQNLATGGESALEILQQLRLSPLTKYIPVAVVTTSEFGSDEQKRRELLRYAEWMMYRKRPSAGFLYHMATSLPSAREQVEDRKWTDLITQTSALVATHEKVDGSQSETDFFNKLNRLFEQIFQFCTYFIGRMEGDKLILFQATHDPKQAALFPDPLKPDDIPFLTKLTASPLKIDALGIEDIGSLSKLKGKPFLGCQLDYEGKCLGVIALFHRPDQPAFRDKDGEFLKHLALQLSHFLGWRAQVLKNQRRQQCLADFANAAASANRIEAILDKLIDLLHQEVNQNDDTHAKTTIRKLQQASGKIIRYGRKGLASTETPLTLDSKDSLYAEALRQRKNLRFGKLEDEMDFKTKQEHSHNMHSSLTVPILSDTHILGAVNLEHQTSNKYDGGDELFVRTLCDLTAAAWMRLKQFEFQQQLIQFLQSLWHEHSFESLQQQIYENLQKLTGYALLLYLLPDPASPTAWRIDRLVDVNPETNLIRDMPASDAALWRTRLEKDWQRTFIYRVLSAQLPTFHYIEGKEAKNYQLPKLAASGERLLIFAEAVIPIYHQAKPSAAIVLLFRLDKTLTHEQQQLLESFGQVIGDILHHIDQVKSMEESLKIAQTEAQLGFLYGQLRHVLINQLGGIGNILGQLKRDGADANKLALINRALLLVDTHLQSMHYLINEPKREAVDLAALWTSLQENFTEHSLYPAQLLIGELIFSYCQTDPNALKAIYYNLVLNAAQACAKAAKPCAVTLSSQTVNGIATLRIQDNGPGLKPDLLARIFDRGYTTRSEGTGFGLYFCQFQAQRLGLSLSAEAAETGACFVLTWQERKA